MIIVLAVFDVLAAALFGYSQISRDSNANQDAQQLAGNSDPEYVATIAPLAAILRELCDGRAEVHTLLKPGASPHTYEPKPSDLKRVVNASGFFYVDEMLDGWAAGLSNEHRVRTMDLVPEKCRLMMTSECCPKKHAEEGHAHHEPVLDPHFWLDPCVVRDSLHGLVEILSQLDPEGAEIYSANAEDFSIRLKEIDVEMHEMIDPLRGSKVATAHPSFQYLCHQYGLEVAMVVTDSPGKEPSPRQMERLAREARETGVQAIYAEPQIPQTAARMLSEASGIALYELDPVGGCEQRCDYDELILYNAQVLVASLK